MLHFGTMSGVRPARGWRGVVGWSGAKVILILLAATVANAQFSASPGSPFAVGSAPRSVALADFNLDGKLDLATANFTANTVTVLLGNGSGGFTAATGSPFSAGTNPQSLAVGDFNGDGKPDIVTANAGSNNVTVLLGNGSGHFTAASGGPFAVGASPVFVAVGDFNRDGNADIVTANSGDNTITILLGDGSGGFLPASGSPVTVGVNPQSVAVADLNKDGAPDLVIANAGGNTVTVLLGNGTGGFTAATKSPFTAGSSPVLAILADMNGDGKLDIVTANSGDNTATELLGDGTGGFTAATNSPFTLGSKPYSLAVADINGDGKLDLAAANSTGNNLTVLLGNGTGGFTAATSSPFATGAGPYSVAVGDFNGDGQPDLATANSVGNTVTVLLNSLPSITVSTSTVTLYAGAGQTSPAAVQASVSSSTTGSTYIASSNKSWLVPTPVSNATGGTATVRFSANPASLAAGVYNGTVRFTSAKFFGAATAVTFSVAAPSGTLVAPAGSPYPVGASPQSVATGDFNRDGNPDLVAANYADNTVTILLGDGSGGFSATPGSPFSVGLSPASVAVADFNLDGKLDIATANSASNNVTVLLGDGSGGFTAAPGSPFAVGTEPLTVVVADFDGDGNPDLVTANYADRDLTVLLGNGSGGFSAAAHSPFQVGTFPQSVAVADVNDDGNPDLVAVLANNYVTVLLGNGSGGFAESGTFPVGTFPQSAAVADFNGDGKPDIATADSGGNTVTLLLGNGSGTFTAASGSPFPVGSAPQSVVAADVNGDGKPDIIAANLGDNTVTVLLGNGSGGFTVAPGSPFPAGTTPFSVVTGDFNGDGEADVAVANVGGNTASVLLGGQAATSSVLSTTAAATIAYGTSVPLTLTVSQPSGGFNAPGGTGTFLDSATSLGTGAQTASPYTLTATGLAAGTHTLSAIYGGDPSNASTISNSISLTVTPASQTVAFGVLIDKTFGNAAFSVAATATSGLPVTFSSTTLSVCTVAGSTVTLAGAGTCTIQASQVGNNNYAAATPVSQTFHVMQASQTITFHSLQSKPFGVPLPVTATASSGLTVTLTATTSAVCTAAGATVTLLSIGSCTIEASQPGNTNYTAATPVDQTFTVTPGSQTITFPTIPNTAFGSAPFAIGATASSGLTVAFQSNTTAVCTVSSGTVTLVSLGSCTLEASQTGNSNYNAATPVSQTFRVAPATQTITFGTLSDQLFGTAPFPISATASSGLTVTFTSTTSPVCTVSGSTVTLVSAGTCNIQATQAGNTSFAAATPINQSFHVTPAVQTITFGTLANKVFGSPAFAVSATASSGAAVSFSSASSTVCTVAGTMVTLVGVGICTVGAAQAGNANYAPADPVDQNFTVTQATQTITFAALQNKTFGAAPFGVSATVSSGLTVSFISTTSAVCTVTGATVSLAGAGTCTVEASQPGNPNYTAATVVDQSFTVNPANQTITFAAIPNQTFGTAPITLNAAASSSLTVSFAATNTAVCTVAGSTVTLVSAGICTIQATQAGNPNYAAAASVSQHFTVAPGSQSITFAALTNQLLGTPPFTLSATASSGLTVSFKSTSSSICTVSSGTVTLLNLGTCAIQASQVGNSDYAAAKPVVQTFTVSSGTLVVGSVATAGSYSTVQIAPDSFAVAFGANFSTMSAQAGSVKLPSTLAGAAVTLTDSTGATQMAQLYYVSPTQINFVVPKGLASGAATLTVTDPAGNTASSATTLAHVSPSLFTADASGTGVAAALAFAYTPGAAPKSLPVFGCTTSPLACTATPIDLGAASTSVYLSLYGTGIRGRSGLSGVSVTLGGTALQVTYAAAQSTYPGLDQVNVLLDRSLIGQGSLTLQLTVDGLQANPVLVNIK